MARRPGSSSTAPCSARSFPSPAILYPNNRRPLNSSVPVEQSDCRPVGRMAELYFWLEPTATRSRSERWDHHEVQRRQRRLCIRRRPQVVVAAAGRPTTYRMEMTRRRSQSFIRSFSQSLFTLIIGKENIRNTRPEGGMNCREPAHLPASRRVAQQVVRPHLD
jgi:hypothetical protein